MEPGEKFGRLRVLSIGKDYMVKCLCDCGNEATVYKYSLTSTRTKSCGCINREMRTVHGLSGEPLYDKWRGMRSRCSENNTQDRKNYFDRGIGICVEWKDNPIAFVEWGKKNGYEQGLEVDRIDNEKGYSPDNCRFVSDLVNTHNQRLLIKTNTSGYSGVHFSVTRRNFVASIRSVSLNFGGKTYIGCSNTAWGACQMRNAFIIKHNLPHKIQGERCQEMTVSI